MIHLPEYFLHGINIPARKNAGLRAANISALCDVWRWGDLRFTDWWQVDMMKWKCTYLVTGNYYTSYGVYTKHVSNICGEGNRKWKTNEQTNKQKNNNYSHFQFRLINNSDSISTIQIWVGVGLGMGTRDREVLTTSQCYDKTGNRRPW